MTSGFQLTPEEARVMLAYTAGPPRNSDRATYLAAHDKLVALSLGLSKEEAIPSGRAGGGGR